MPLPSRILVVDDHVDSADSLAAMLEDEAHEVQTAYNGQEALDRAAAFDPQLIILDLHMPVMNGFKAARALRLARGDRNKLVLIALSGLMQVSERAEALDSGFDIILPKPLEESHMRSLVDSVLAQPGVDPALATVDLSGGPNLP